MIEKKIGRQLFKTKKLLIYKKDVIALCIQ